MVVKVQIRGFSNIQTANVNQEAGDSRAHPGTRDIDELRAGSPPGCAADNLLIISWLAKQAPVLRFWSHRQTEVLTSVFYTSVYAYSPEAARHTFAIARPLPHRIDCDGFCYAAFSPADPSSGQAADRSRRHQRVRRAEHWAGAGRLTAPDQCCKPSESLPRRRPQVTQIGSREAQHLPRDPFSSMDTGRARAHEVQSTDVEKRMATLGPTPHRPRPAQWPKVLPPLNDEQRRVSDDCYRHWHESLAEHIIAAIEEFNHLIRRRASRLTVPAHSRTRAGHRRHIAHEDSVEPRAIICIELRQHLADRIMAALSAASHRSSAIASALFLPVP